MYETAWHKYDLRLRIRVCVVFLKCVPTKNSSLALNCSLWWWIPFLSWDCKRHCHRWIVLARNCKSFSEITLFAYLKKFWSTFWCFLTNSNDFVFYYLRKEIYLDKQLKKIQSIFKITFQVQEVEKKRKEEKDVFYLICTISNRTLEEKTKVNVTELYLGLVFFVVW